MLQNENLHAKIGFATAENGSSKILHKNSVLTFGMRIRRKKPQVGARLALPPEVVLRQRAEDGAGRVLDSPKKADQKFTKKLARCCSFSDVLGPTFANKYAF